MRIRTRFTLAFGSLFIILVTASGVILYNLLTIQNDYQHFLDVELKQAELAEEIRYYDVLLTDSVRAYVIDPENEEYFDSYFAAADALDEALAEARAGATTQEELEIFAEIDAINFELIAI